VCQTLGIGASVRSCGDERIVEEVDLVEIQWVDPEEYPAESRLSDTSGARQADESAGPRLYRMARTVV
jgi:hypothetical protein